MVESDETVSTVKRFGGGISERWWRSGEWISGTGAACVDRENGQCTHTALIPIVGIVLSMGKNTSFSLDEHYSAFIDEEVASGRYRSASDVVRTALRLLEDRETRLLALRRALITGERSGESTPFDFDEFVARKRAEDPRRR